MMDIIDELMHLPCFARATIPPEYHDVMEHMNIRWYMALFDEAAFELGVSFGMTHEYYVTKNSGFFALQQFIHYYAEVRAGDTVGVHTRILGRSEKRIHFMHFMVNETEDVLAATCENLAAHVDRTIRHMSVFPDEIAAHIDKLLTEHEKLSWDAPISGVIHP